MGGAGERTGAATPSKEKGLDQRLRGEGDSRGSKEMSGRGAVMKLEVGRVEGQEREKEPRGKRDGRVGGNPKEEMNAGEVSKGKCDWAGGKGRNGVCPRTELGGRPDPGSDPVAPSIKDLLRQWFLNYYPQVLRKLAKSIDPGPQPTRTESESLKEGLESVSVSREGEGLDQYLRTTDLNHSLFQTPKTSLLDFLILGR